MIVMNAENKAAMSCGFVNHLGSRTSLAPIQDWHLMDQEAS